MTAPASRNRTGALLVGATVACLVPFLNKAFHIDDPLFLWVAERIPQHPLAPYDFDVVWYQTATRVADITKNPPLACYASALVIALFGMSERALHGAFLVPAVAVVVGTYRLAARMCGMAWLAAAAALASPVFLVSASGVMCDTPMLAFWVWAVVLWIEGLDRDDHRRLAAAAALVALGALTKYFALALLPLLAAYTIARRTRGWMRCAHLLLPVAVAAGYQAWTASVYGRGLLSDAAQYATDLAAGRGSWSAMALVGLTFTGGCVAVPLLLAPWLVSRDTLFKGAIAIAAAVLFLPTPGFDVTDWRLRLQFLIWAAVGAGVLALAAADAFRARDPESLLLGLWVGGTFVFAAFVNWSVNGRSVLPLVPAVGILMARRIEALRPERAPWTRRGIAAALGLATGLALLVTSADARLADSAREASEEIRRRHAASDPRVWFQGHWGFQFYAQRWGAVPVDLLGQQPEPGDWVVVPGNNTNTDDLPAATFPRFAVLEFGVLPWVTTMHRDRHAGFWSDVWGALPFTFGPVPKETYELRRFAGARAPGEAR